MKTLIYVGFAFPHHKDTHGGYQHIADYLSYDKIINVQSWYESSIKNSRAIFYRILRKICFILTGEYTIPFYLFRIWWISLFHHDVVFHVIYGENIMHRWLLHCVGRNSLVCTFHQPFDWFQNQPIWKSYLKRIDALILMSDDEVDMFKRCSGKKNITFIPHGICTDFYFLPNKSIVQKNGSILMVGNWLRDFEFANKVFESLLQQDPSLAINVVCRKDAWSFFKDKRIQCYTHLSDAELRQLYWQSSVMFLPLKRFTANNALLEAASCGCHIAIASSQVDNSYIPEAMIEILPLNIDACVTYLKEAVKERTFNDDLSKYVKKNYSWDVIASKTKDFLQNV